jgi:hypothetical protein
MTADPHRPIYRLPEDERAAILLPLVGKRVELVHAPLRGQEQSPDVYRGELLAFAVVRSGGYPYVAVVRLGLNPRDTVAIPSAQIATVREIIPPRTWEHVHDPDTPEVVLYSRLVQEGGPSLGGLSEKDDGWHAYRYGRDQHEIGVFRSRQGAEAAVEEATS